jgi:hypothetical protein
LFFCGQLKDSFVQLTCFDSRMRSHQCCLAHHLDSVIPKNLNQESCKLVVDSPVK